MAKKILTVDDSATIRQILETSLTDAGYEVVSAVNGEEALAKMATDQVQMLITDLNMPKMNGIDLIRAVRKNPSCRFMPILMLTTETQDSKRQEGKAAGASAWLVKPFRPEQLIKIVQTVLP